MTGRKHLHQIAHLARSVSGALALETVLKKVTAAVVELLPEAGCVIRMVDEEAGGYRLAAQGGAAAEGFPPLVPFVVPFGEGLTHAVVAGRRPVLVSDGSADPRSASRSWAIVGPLRGYYGIPIDAGDEVFGVLSVLFPTGEVPAEDVREMFELLAGQAAVAIHNARLFARSEAQRHAAESLAEMARAVSESLDPDEVGQRIVDGVRALFGAATAGFYGRAPKSGDLVAVAFAGNLGEASKEQLVYPSGISSVGLAVRDRMAVVTRDVLTDPRITLTPEIRARIQKAAFRSTLAVPLMAHDRVIGALAIGDQGTTVTFRLPVGGERPETPPEVPAKQPAPMAILVIDDEPEVRATLVDMLEEQGHVVHQAAGGVDGLTALAGLGAIDVVFTDLGMPGMNGWEVARAIKARRPTLPVVLVTGWGTGSETSPERGAVDLVLAKPLTNAGLRAAIAEVAARRPPSGQ